MTGYTLITTKNMNFKVFNLTLKKDFTSYFLIKKNDKFSF